MRVMLGETLEEEEEADSHATAVIEKRLPLIDDPAQTDSKAGEAERLVSDPESSV